jgi:DNA/RNA endonuclease YhcR with UshA esterase domain
MLQKEERVVMVLLSMAAISLIIGYFGFSSQIPAYSDESKIGEKVFVEGTILSKQKTGTGDNVILTISNLNIKVFIGKENGAKDVYDSVNEGDRVRITGKVSEYKNAREIVVETVKDVITL